VIAPAYGYGGYGLGRAGGYLYGAGNYMSGVADTLSATGQYNKDVQSAALTREQVRQESIKTRRMRMQEEIEYERNRPTAITMRDQQLATDLNWARRDPPRTEIYSGKTLNVLYRSCLDSGPAGAGPSVPVAPDVLKHLNLSDKTTRGNTGLFRNNGRLSWPVSLQEPMFDEARDKFSASFAKVAESINKYNAAPEVRDQRELRAAYQALNDRLEAAVKGMTPSDYIGARRYLNQLKDALTAMSNPAANAYFDKSWQASVRSVGELVKYMAGKGLEFAPATAPGDDAAYVTFYYNLRAFEGGLWASRR
jgi:hypothetical protein